MRRTRVDRPSRPVQPGRSGRAAAPASDSPEAIDSRYGLEPVFEPGDADDARRAPDSGPGARCLQAVHCPYCGEPFETLVDLSAGSADYIEDCQVCCRPIQFHLEVDHEGDLIRLTAGRDD